jgi:hypothetical protein
MSTRGRRVGCAPRPLGAVTQSGNGREHGDQATSARRCDLSLSQPSRAVYSVGQFAKAGVVQALGYITPRRSGPCSD